AALRGLRSVAADGGRLLFGDGFWERPPTPHLEQMLGPQSGLDELVETASAAGWRQVHVSTAGQAEWDAFETTWVSGVREWADAHDGDDAAAARALAEEHWRDYAEGYRGVLGFAYLVLDAVS